MTVPAKPSASATTTFTATSTVGMEAGALVRVTTDGGNKVFRVVTPGNAIVYAGNRKHRRAQAAQKRKKL